MTATRSRRAGVLSLLTVALAQSSDLVQNEFRLARAELAESLTQLRVGLVMMAIGAILLIVALGMLLQALVAALIDAGLSPPAAILLVAGTTAVAGLVLFLMGQKRMSPETLTPDRTLDSVTADSRMLKETLS